MIRDRVLRLAGTGLRGQQIADQAGTTIPYVYKVCRLAGVDLPVGRPRKPREERMASKLNYSQRRAAFLAEIRKVKRDAIQGRTERADASRPRPKQFRCDCGRISKTVPCICGFTPTWAEWFRAA